jgi:serine protease AprX
MDTSGHDVEGFSMRSTMGSTGPANRLSAARAAVAFAAALTLTAAALTVADPAAATPPSTRIVTGSLVRVIVRYDRAVDAEQAVTRLGGRVVQWLTAVGVLTGEVPVGALDALRAAPGVQAVTADRQVRLAGATWNADGDPNSLYNIESGIGVQNVWGTKDAAGQVITGKGVGVALIDSGIAPVAGLSDPAKVVNGPDLSFESQAPNLRYLDTFGHGTHMAGIIAGRDPGVADGSLADGTSFVGVAPGATLVNVKVAAADGATDVSQVIAAIDWVVVHRNDTAAKIRVLNLSFGTDSAQDERLDPLSHAVEAAWRNGIVVVVSAGNDGTAPARLSMPAVNPYVIAVGAADPMGSAARADDTVAAFSTRGNATRHADLVASGKSVVSLRNPHSYVDVTYPTGLIPGDKTQRFFRGSGTSQAAAVVSGAAALLLQQRPNLTPDQVKRLLTSTAEAMPKADVLGRGAGQLNVGAAIKAATPVYTQTFPASTGTGSLEQSRGTSHVADPANGIELRGETDIMGHAWTPATWAPAALTGRTWTTGTWNGTDWTGTDWTGSSWAGRTWTATAWTGRTWTGTAWAGRTWTSAVWDGRTWTGRTWTGTVWDGRTWTGGNWSSGRWQ